MESILYDSKNSHTYKFGLHILDYVPRNKKQSIIDIGSGSGALTKELASYANNVIGIDKCIKTVEHAQEKYPTVPFYVMDALRLQYVNRFDIAFSNATVQCIEDKKKLFESIFKCLKDGGQFIAEFPSSNGSVLYFDYLDKVLAKYGLGNEAKTYFCINKDECARLLVETGFTISHIEEGSHLTYVRGDDDSVREHIYSTVSSSVSKELREKIVDELVEFCLNNFKTIRGWVKEVCRVRVIADKPKSDIDE